jgi:hypothetical protein
MRRLFVIWLVMLISGNAFSQISIRYLNGKKTCYHYGDTIRIEVMMSLNPKSCLEGMKKSYIYLSGCEDILKSQWMKRANNIYQKNLALKVTGNAKNKAKLTLTRNTDKESYFRQETFNVK